MCRLADGGRVLDAGAGRGEFSQLLLERAPRVCSLDISLGFIAEMRPAPTAKLHRLVADVLSLPFAPGVVDSVACLEVLEHVATPERAVEELARVVRRGGFVIFSVPTRLSEKVFCFLYRGWLDVCQHRNVFERGELENLMRNRGLTVVRQYRLHFWPVLFWFFHCLLRTPHDGTGVVQKNLWLNRWFEKALAILERLKIARSIERIGGLFIFKSWVLVCQKTGVVKG